MLLHAQNGHSIFPWNLPIWSPDYAVFFGVLYLVLLVLGCGLGVVFLKTLRDCRKDDPHAGH